MDEQYIKLSTSIQYLTDITDTDRKSIDGLHQIVDILQLRNRVTDQQLLVHDYELKDMWKEIKKTKKEQDTSGIGYFLKKNWWKLGSFILAFSTILGTIGEYLYRLAPPK